MQNQRILWFQDGAKLGRHWSKWQEIDSLTQRLVSLSGDPSFTHSIVNPLPHMETLFKCLNFNEFSTVCDLTGGKFTPFIHSASPSTEVISSLHLSRIRVVSSPRMDGIGHFVSLSSPELSQIKKRFDFSHPLLLDDVCWSGRTVKDSIDLLGISPETVTFGSLVINTGSFGVDKPGAASVLSTMGIKVVSADTVNTPEDDGFHLADFFTHPQLGTEAGFGLIVNIQTLREQSGDTDKEVRQLLAENKQLLFPQALDTAEIKKLQLEGRVFAPNGINKNSFFDRNPPNWLLPSFSRRVSSRQLLANQAEIIETIREFQSLLPIIEPAREHHQELCPKINNSREREI